MKGLMLARHQPRLDVGIEQAKGLLNRQDGTCLESTRL